MAKGVNKAILIGNLGNDPEIRYTPSGSAVATISIATTDVWRDKVSGELKEQTEWHRVVLFNRLAEIAGEYLHKGSKVYIEGSIRTRKWQDNNGMDRYTTEIVAGSLQMLDSRGTSGNEGFQQQMAMQPRETAKPTTQMGAVAAATTPTEATDNSIASVEQEKPAATGDSISDPFADDDIPF